MEEIEDLIEDFVIVRRRITFTSVRNLETNNCCKYVGLLTLEEWQSNKVKWNTDEQIKSGLKNIITFT